MSKTKGKPMISSQYREAGVIKEVDRGPNDTGLQTCWVVLDLDGASQNFGGLALQKPELNQSFVRDLCATFSVSNLRDLLGKKCYALRCFDSCNELIEGLEDAETGRRFILTDWRRKHWPETKDVLTSRKESLEKDITYMEARIRADKRILENLHKRYVDWSGTHGHE